MAHQSSPLISIDVLLFRTTPNNQNLPAPTCLHDGPLNQQELALLPPTVNAQNFVCRTRTNAKGEYVFDDVPVGLYVVVRTVPSKVGPPRSTNSISAPTVLDAVARDRFRSRSEGGNNDTQRLRPANALRDRHHFFPWPRGQIGQSRTFFACDSLQSLAFFPV